MQKSFFCKSLLIALCSSFCASAASADELVFGVATDFGNSQRDSIHALDVEYHFDPFRTFLGGQLAVFGVGQIDNQGSVYLGLGLSNQWKIGGNWFAEGSFATGYYDAGSTGLDLGGNVQFRTLVGVGYQLTEQSRISLAVDHMSNASLEELNPGIDKVSVRYSRKF